MFRTDTTQYEEGIQARKAAHQLINESHFSVKDQQVPATPPPVRSNEFVIVVIGLSKLRFVHF